MSFFKNRRLFRINKEKISTVTKFPNTNLRNKTRYIFPHIILFTHTHFLKVNWIKLNTYNSSFSVKLKPEFRSSFPQADTHNFLFLTRKHTHDPLQLRWKRGCMSHLWYSPQPFASRFRLVVRVRLPWGSPLGNLGPSTKVDKTSWN